MVGEERRGSDTVKGQRWKRPRRLLHGLVPRGSNGARKGQRTREHTGGGGDSTSPPDSHHSHHCAGSQRRSRFEQSYKDKKMPND